MLPAWVVLVAAGISALAPVTAVIAGFIQQTKLILDLREEVRLLRQELAEAKLANVILKSAR
jgi:hypothetical protein